jgi:hypothetical protein
MPEDSAVSVIMQFFTDVPPIATSLIALLALVAVALWWGGRVVENREYVLEQ